MMVLSLHASVLLLLVGASRVVLGAKYQNTDLDPSECQPRCENGGTCYQSHLYVGIGFCRCPPGYEGTLCTEQVAHRPTPAAPTQVPPQEPLAPKIGNSRCRGDHDCLNGGSCFDGFCFCTQFYTGVNCQLSQERDPATEAPPPVATTRPAHRQCPAYCVHGHCDTTLGKCDCQPGYVGQRCETRSGGCRYSLHTFALSCSCLVGYGGRYCHERVTCPALATVITYGSVTLSNGAGSQGEAQPYGTVARYSCDAGYILSGDATRTCQNDGSWSGAAMPRCVPAPTTQPPRPACYGQCVRGRCDDATGKCRCPAGYHGDRCNQQSGSCHYTVFGVRCTCYPGYTGQYCQDKAVVKCVGLSANLQYGRVTFSQAAAQGRYRQGTSVRYSCGKGYVLSGSSSRFCSRNGQWNGTSPMCSPVQCNYLPSSLVYGRVTFTMPVVQGRYPYSTMVSYSCGKGYVLAGSPRRHCGHDGQWNGTSASCSPVKCGYLPTMLQYGRVEFSQAPHNRAYPYQAWAKYSCGKGYVLRGNSHRYCSQDGSWNGSTPSCFAASCKALPNVLRYGTIVFSNAPVKGLYRYMTKATHSCSNGFILQGNAKRYCLDNGNWNGTMPACVPHRPQPQMCTALSAPAHGSVQSNQYAITVLTVFSCDAGYRLSGSVARICLPSGQWSGTDTVCTAVLCPAPGRIQNGQISGYQRSVGSVITYTCRQGYLLMGAAEIRCLMDGQWSSRAPVCVPQTTQIQQCCALDIVPNAIISRGQGLRYIGARVLYRCRPGFQLQSGTLGRFCQASGVWSGSPPQCVPEISCPDPGTVANAQRSVSDPQYTVGSTVSFMCNAGYTLTGANRLVCTQSGQWSSPLPVCASKVTCDGRFVAGQQVYISPGRNQPKAADFIVVVEESHDLALEYSSLEQAIANIEANLTSMGVGTTSALRNQYTLVGYGQSEASGRSCVNRLLRASNGKTTFPAEFFPSAAFGLIPDRWRAASRDAYSAIAYGLTMADLRYGPNIAHNLILLTSSDRGVPCPPGISRNATAQALQANGFLANFIVNQQLLAGYDKEEDVFAIRRSHSDGSVSAVLRNKKSNLRKVTDVYVNFTRNSTDNTNEDYTQLALENGGIVWNLNMLKTGSINVENSFKFAFRTVKSSEVYLQAHSCKTCTCLESGNMQCQLVADQDECLDRCVLQQSPIVPANDCSMIPHGDRMCIGDSICNF
ncbi:sushi, von Willebrand factor type A, EGF and pentraxin domain-containing protein 1-like [Sycon ciliatum]|uniref:sushi, von Willebrand factor type A, EGF and pentraxin domain-containing protein 1-like n=1 Tax=Sycon ciliatum TaxID=27933 RepID=UPI0031F71DB5